MLLPTARSSGLNLNSWVFAAVQARCNSQNLAPHLQVQLYEDFAKSRAKASVDESISSASAEEAEKPKLKATGHVFQVGPRPFHFPGSV